MRLEELFVFLLNNSITAGWVILAVMVLRLPLKKAPRRLSCLLWALPALRLALPFSVKSVLSLIPSGETVPVAILTEAVPRISSNLPVIDHTVNPVLQTAFSPSPADSANPMQLVMAAAAVLWLAGLTVMLALCLFSALRLRRGLALAVRGEDGAWRCETVSSPFVFGVLRPRIYLPYALEGRELSHVLAHENAHLRRGDHIFKLLGYLLLAVYWFQPLVWAAYLLLGRDMEFACDEAVVEAMDETERKAYSRALLRCADKRRPAILCPPAFGELGVKERIKKVLNFKRPAVVITVIAVLVLAVAALCLLTDPKTPPETPETPAQDSQSAGVYLRLDMAGVYRLDVSYSGGSGGCVNADGSPFDRDEYIWLDQLEGLEGKQEFAVSALDAKGDVIGMLRWTLELVPGERVELDWASGEPLPLETATQAPPDPDELSGEELEQAIQLANRELKRLFELGVLSHELSMDGHGLRARVDSEMSLGESYYGRVLGDAYYISNGGGTDGLYYLTLRIDRASERIVTMTVIARASDSDKPIADREPIYIEGPNQYYYYYDKLADILPEGITVDQLCTRLNEYWGFDGYTVSGTVYADYHYNTQPPAGDSLVKDLTDAPFLTVYFQGDQEGAPMYVDIHNLPGNTTVMIGTNHAVG